MGRSRRLAPVNWAAALLLVTSLGVGYTPPAKAPFEIELANVNEVCLCGRADLAYWRQRLQPEGLQPTVSDGRAELVVCGMASRWMGIPFREAIVSVYTSNKADGSSRDGFYLVGALNSIPLFAWVERHHNHAPYESGQLTVGSDASHADLVWASGDRPVLTAARQGPSAALSSGRDDWEGPIHLPKALNPKAPAGSYFWAKLDGVVTRYPFRSGADTFKLGPSTVSSVARQLRDSGFVPTEWRIRPSASHAKSGTLNR